MKIAIAIQGNFQDKNNFHWTHTWNCPHCGFKEMADITAFKHKNIITTCCFRCDREHYITLETPLSKLVERLNGSHYDS